MNSSQLRFLHAVREFVKENPEIAPQIVNAASDGIKEALASANERACDMESAFATQLTTRSKAKRALPYLNKWRGKTSLNWEWVFQNNQLK